MQRNTKIKKLCECAMLVALATVLSFVKLYEAPLGGAVTLFSMVPILMCGFVYGVKAGFATAFVYSVIQLILGIGTIAYVPDPMGVVICVLLDYLVAFTLLGVAGFFKRLKINLYVKVTLGSLVALILRFLSHFIGGAWIWYEITRDGAWNDYVFKYGKWAYSLIYNAWYMLPEILLCLIAVPVTVALMRAVWGKKLEA
ncbi:MAG: energy-coupled thiamine transporter ThiT [Clostridia bacterium]|nr:energy-coupled thiamine transporter ThiT [Clostridia bacterium]